ncbi:helix-turn-helix domain-containing protein [Streptomyces sp. YS-3]|uniref:helix-turn-helix domain-containing protein n=1 Tax=Streptomyces sp. YS-3 TaxID=3381352 RepID=UPI00386292B5
MVMKVEGHDKRLHKIKDAAQVLGYGRSFVFEEIRLGRLRTVGRGHTRRVPTEYLEEYIELLKREAMTDAN